MRQAYRLRHLNRLLEHGTGIPHGDGHSLGLDDVGVGGDLGGLVDLDVAEIDVDLADVAVDMFDPAMLSTITRL